MKKVDYESDEAITVKALVYGRSGTGKTSLGVTAPKPLILLSEEQGIVHVKQAARRLKVPCPDTILMSRTWEYKAVISALNRPKRDVLEIRDGDGNVVTSVDWPETVVVDSLTDACQIIVDQIDHESPPKIGNDGLPRRNIAFWGVLTDRVRAFMRAFRGLPTNVLHLALMEEKTWEEGDVMIRSLGPQLPMQKLKESVSAAVNLVGYSYRTTKRRGKGFDVSYGIQTTGPESMVTKPYRPLRDREVPDFSYWVDAIKGQLDEERDAPEATDELPDVEQQEQKPPEEKKESK